MSNNLAWNAWWGKDQRGAQSYVTEALAIKERIQDREGMIQSLHLQGLLDLGGSRPILAPRIGPVRNAL
ncbi:MAG: hypothetical protein ACREX4_20905 [Gammaproteobacteria bacterium]